MSRLKYFLDTEFIEDGKTIDLISIGIACNDGRTFYRQNSECKFDKASDWVWRNVFPHLVHFDMRGKRSCSPVVHSYNSGLDRREITPCSGTTVEGKDRCFWATRSEIRTAVLDFCDVVKYGKPEFWGYFADYDWVAFCQLFGTMAQLPKGFPMYCMDLKQLANQLGDIQIPKPEVEIHHALADAEWAMASYDFLASRSTKP